MISFKQFLNEALSVSNTHYKKYFDLVQSYVGANKRKEIVNGNDIKIIFLNGSKEIVTLNYEGDGRKLELKSFIKDNKETNIDKEIRDTKSIRDLIGTPLDFYFSNDKSSDKSNDKSNDKHNNIKRVNGKYQPKTKEELKELCDDLDVHLGDIDTSLITDMGFLFKYSKRTNKQFEGIEDWDVSKVTDMRSMFEGAKNFNQPLNKWDVSKVTDMRSIFYEAKNFNQPLNKWDVSKVTNMSCMFANASLFNQPLNSWDVSKVNNMGAMFSDASLFNQPLNNWDVSNVKGMHSMFAYTSFNQDLSSWELKQVRDTDYMFDGCPIKREYRPSRYTGK